MIPRLALVLALAGGLAAAGHGAEWTVEPGGRPLAAVLERAADGDVVRVRGGEHAGPLRVERSIELIGEGRPTLEGNGRGTVLSVAAPGVRVEGFRIRGSGTSLDEEDAGLELESAGAVVRDNLFEDVLFGIYVRSSPGARVEENRIEGKTLSIARRGDAIRVWYSDGVRISDNRVRRSRDVVLWYSNDLEISGNEIFAGRYGLHFMYCDDARITGNLLVQNSVGGFLMYSRRLRMESNSVVGNHGPSGYGLGLKDMDDAAIVGNRIVGNRVGVFLDNSPREAGSRSDVRGNLLAGNDVGVLLMPNVARADFGGNDFVENQTQVGLAGAGGDARANVWSENYWSDYAGFDADGDGHGDLAYRSERMFEQLTDRKPELRLFLESPAAIALDLAARAFPVVRPRPKLTDERPRVSRLQLAGLPAVPAAAGTRGWGWATLGLIASAIGLTALPWRRRGHSAGVPEGSPARAERGTVEGSEIVRVEGLIRDFGDKRALDRVDLSILEGESVALWGANGAGKTTALRAMLGVMRFRGEIRVGGWSPLVDGRAVRAQVGFVPQEVSLQGEIGVRETLDFFAALRRASTDQVDELLDWLGLLDDAERAVGALSGGQKQRLALGLALLGDPPILFLDEPTANLDAAARVALYERLDQLRRAGKTLIFTSHRVEEVELLADRVLVLEAGRLVADGPPSEVSLDSRSEIELDLRLAPDRLAAAREALAAGGFAARQVGPRLVMNVPMAAKAEPLNLLAAGGFRLEDFSYSASGASPNGGAHRA